MISLFDKKIISLEMAQFAGVRSILAFAAANGETTAKLSKADLAEKITKEQIAEAQDLSREMVEANPKLIN